MAYTNFTARDLTKKFGIKFRAEHLFEKMNVPKVEPSSWLKETLSRGQRIGFSSEKSRSERLVSPILTELSIENQEEFTIYSGMLLNVDEANGLNGECDFMLSFSKIQDFVVAPIFNITEAKKQDIESGTIQCAAQLIAANQLNQNEGYNFKTLFGCSTTGTEWRFIKLENNVITLDIDRYFLSNIDTLLGVLQVIVDKGNEDYREFE
ncbi:MAG: hypothetical protein AB8G11_04805 [Saprospiraceae bacterium]